jgi:hypothetical protein
LCCFNLLKELLPLLGKEHRKQSLQEQSLGISVLQAWLLPRDDLCRLSGWGELRFSITIFPAAFLTASEMLSLCTSIAIYLLLFIEGASF